MPVRFAIDNMPSNTPVHFIPLPSKFGKAKVTFAARLSTPKDKQGDKIDPSSETILFLHPVWADGGFFYPQFEDPALHERFNLLAVDLPGHGQTTVKGSVGTYTYDKLVDHLASLLKVLKLDSVHVVGMSCGAICGFHLTAKHPDKVASLLTFGFRAGADGDEMKESYGECRELMVESLKHKTDDIDMVTNAMFEFGFGSSYAVAHGQLKRDCMAQAHTWSSGGSKERAHMIWNPPISRPTPGADDLKAIRCAWLSVQAEDNVPDVTAMMEQHNSVRVAGVPAGRCMVIPDSPLWMTLAHPELTNPLIAQFLKQRSTTMLLLPSRTSSGSAPPSPGLRTPNTPTAHFSTSEVAKATGWPFGGEEEGQTIQLASW